LQVDALKTKLDAGNPDRGLAHIVGLNAVKTSSEIEALKCAADKAAKDMAKDIVEIKQMMAGLAQSVDKGATRPLGQPTSWSRIVAPCRPTDPERSSPPAPRGAPQADRGATADRVPARTNLRGKQEALLREMTTEEALKFASYSKTGRSNPKARLETVTICNFKRMRMSMIRTILNDKFGIKRQWIKNIYIKRGRLIEILVDEKDKRDIVRLLQEKKVEVKANLPNDDPLVWPGIDDPNERKRRAVDLQKEQLKKMAETCTHGGVQDWIKRMIDMAQVPLTAPAASGAGGRVPSTPPAPQRNVTVTRSDEVDVVLTETTSGEEKEDETRKRIRRDSPQGGRPVKRGLAGFFCR
jgi:hypothetical protein